MTMLDSRCMENLKLKNDLKIIARRSDRRVYSKYNMKPDLILIDWYVYISFKIKFLNYLTKLQQKIKAKI